MPILLPIVFNIFISLYSPPSKVFPIDIFFTYTSPSTSKCTVGFTLLIPTFSFATISEFVATCNEFVIVFPLTSNIVVVLLIIYIF